MKKFTIQTILLLIIIGGALFLYKNQNFITRMFLPGQEKTAVLMVDGTKLNVDLADTQDERNKGLSGQDSLASDSGMLFVFDHADRYPFWMKGMRFPLDFIWIRNNKVIEVTENAPQPKAGQSDRDLFIYEPRETVDMVLEVNSGFVHAHNIKAGDEVKVVQ